jgi:four helix bundle protein
MQTKEYAMLRIHDVMLEVLCDIRPLKAAIARNDANLTDQLTRAATSVLLNIAEGSGSFGGVRRARYRTALGSSREALSSLLAAEALGYIGALPQHVVAKLNHVIGTLVRVSK